jgi:CheY-like chemotaxis protein
MTFSRQSESPRENLNLIDIVEDSVDLLKSSMPSSIQLKTYNNTSRDRVAAEKTQLSQVLVTIVNNAIQALEGKDGEINIRVDNIEVGEELLVKSPRLHAGNYVRLRVEDNGIGMDTATLERVFEPFFSTRANGEGSGLGLSVAYGIISNFGGEILVESSIGEGSTFTVLLPSHEGMPNRDAITHIDKPVSQGGELVLYIDDDIEIAELGKEMLENLGYEVAISTSSEQALEMFRSDPEDFDVIITDQSMPVLTGTQLAREIKRVNPTIPIILVTGFSASMLNQELVNSGINHCIAKPVVADELGRAILQVLTENNNT